MKSRLAEKERDLEFLVSLRNEPGVTVYSNRGVVPSEILEKDYFNTPANHVYVIEEENVKIGYVICHDRTAKAEGCFYISVALSPEMRGKGYGGKMMQEAASICIDQYGANEVVADVHANNLPSIKSMEKVGFTITKREGAVWEMMYRKDNDHTSED